MSEESTVEILPIYLGLAVIFAALGYTLVAVVMLFATAAVVLWQR